MNRLGRRGSGRFRQLRALGRPAHGAHEPLKIAVRRHCEEASPLPGLNSVSVRDALRREQDGTRADSLLPVLNLHAKLALKDLKDLVFGTMEVQGRRVAMGHSMVEDRDAILPIRVGYADCYERVQKPEFIWIH